MATYEIDMTSDAIITTYDGKSITVAMATPAPGKLLKTVGDTGVNYFYIDDARALYILAPVESGAIISGIPVLIDRPAWYAAIQCAVNGAKCD